MGKFVQKPIMKWILEGDPVPVETRILQLIIERGDNPYRPTELLDAMHDHIPPYDYNLTQKGLSNLIEGNEVDFTNDRKIILTK